MPIGNLAGRQFPIRRFRINARPETGRQRDTKVYTYGSNRVWCFLFYTRASRALADSGYAMFFEFEVKGPAAEAQSLHSLGPASVSTQDYLDQVLFESV